MENASASFRMDGTFKPVASAVGFIGISLNNCGIGMSVLLTLALP